MSDDPIRAEIEAAGGSTRLLGAEAVRLHRKKFGEDAAPNQNTAKVVVQDLQADPELAPAFKRLKPSWEDVQTGGRSAKVAYIAAYGVDEYLRLSREGHARAKAQGR